MTVFSPVRSIVDLFCVFSEAVELVLLLVLALVLLLVLLLLLLVLALVLLLVLLLLLLVLVLVFELVLRTETEFTAEDVSSTCGVSTTGVMGCSGGKLATDSHILSQKLNIFAHQTASELTTRRE